MSPIQKALLIASKGSGKVEVGTRPIPTPGPGQVLVKVQSAALNPVDNLIKNIGAFADQFGYPALIGNDGAGIIEDMAADVQGWKKGDRVVIQGYWDQDRCTLQQYALSDAVRCAKIPESWSFDEAATLPLGLATAAIGLYQTPTSVPSQGIIPGQGGGAGLLAPWECGVGNYAGQAAVVFGGSSSVGQFALTSLQSLHPIQLAKLSGFDPIITTASKNNEAYCKLAGATHVIDYHDVPYDDIPAAIARLTEKPVQLVYDAVSSEPSQKSGWAVLGRGHGGNMVIVLHPLLGFTSGQIVGNGKRLVLVHGSIQREDNHDFGAKMFGRLTALLEKRELKPNNVQLIPGGLAGAITGLDRLSKGVSAVKLVVRPQETA
ncbi:GroES-like protein [Amylostereum chailletii]|nr:GroES-like protein [Amylostereum chailletii]